MLFDLTGAAASHAAVEDAAGKIVAPLIISGIVAASWALRPESRRLRDDSGRPTGLFRPRLLVADIEAARGYGRMTSRASGRIGRPEGADHEPCAAGHRRPERILHRRPADHPPGRAPGADPEGDGRRRGQDSHGRRPAPYRGPADLPQGQQG